MENNQKRVLQEAKNIREKYLPENSKTEDKITTLRKLDKSAERPGRILSLSIGIISVLILGVGMCCTMIWSESFFALGIVAGIIGLVGIAGAYSVYVHITKKQREKIAPQIQKLADEIIENPSDE